MLRTLYPPSNEPKLVDLCRNKKWIAVSLRSLSHPTEAAPTQAAITGEGSTVLATAVRSGAPLSVLQALVKANVHQLGVVHGQRGSILHEALKHRVPDDCLRFLLQSVIDYERTVFQEHSQEQRGLLGRQDCMGRTALHFMVERAVQELLASIYSSRFGQTNVHHDIGLSRGNWVIFQSLVLSHPPAIHVMDCDGNTPLVLLLLASERIHRHPHARHHEETRASADWSIPVQKERIIFRMIQLLVTTCPSTSTISRRLPRPFRCCAQHNFPSHSNGDSKSLFHHQKEQLIGDGSPNPLSCALLYKRSLETIQLLLKANEKVGVRGCMTLVSHYHEVALHVAVTMRVPVPILDRLVRHGPRAVLVRDAHGLAPLDWCWIRHVVDWFTPASERNVLASRRRHIANPFPRWHEQVSQHYHLSTSRRVSGCCHGSHEDALTARQRQTTALPGDQNISALDDHNLSSPPLTEFQLIGDMWHRMRALLPVLAHQQVNALIHEYEPDESRRSSRSTFATTSSTWSVLHAACFVSCPLAVVRMALSRSPRRWLACRDAIFGRLPLHFAASHITGYNIQVPVGFTNEHFEHIAEPSPVQDVVSAWEQAARVTDEQGQLPLHIAIDAHKSANNEIFQRRLRAPHDLVNQVFDKEQHRTECVLELLLSHYPEALERRDGKSRLFPFQQAAAGDGANLSTIFMLLQRQPMLVHAQIT